MLRIDTNVFKCILDLNQLIYFYISYQRPVKYFMQKVIIISVSKKASVRAAISCCWTMTLNRQTYVLPP